MLDVILKVNQDQNLQMFVFPEIIKTSNKHYGTVSSTSLNLFLKSYREKGVIWFINLFKTFSLFGNSPRITETNLEKNSWTPYHFQATVSIYLTKPLHMILIKGNQNKFNKLLCSSYLNGRLIQQIKINKESSDSNTSLFK